LRLEIATPTGVTTVEDVCHLGIETPTGAYGVLQHRLDFVAPLVPGVLSYRIERGAEHFVAIDEGVVVKCGNTVQVAVRRAIGDVPLTELRETVKREFLALDEQERRFREALALVESHFFRRLKELSAHATM
jgi:F-type H+-transporting ATPase subunit epsilon